MITVVASLRYDDAIVLPRKDKESANVLALSLLSNLLVNSLLLIIILFFGKKIIHVLNLPSGLTILILCLIPLGAFLYNTYQAFNYWLIRHKKYYSVSLNKFVRRGGEGAAQVAFGLSGNLNGLILSDIIGQTLNASTAIIQAWRNGFRFGIISLNKLKYVIHKFSEFPRFNLIPALMSAGSYYLPTLFINKFFSSESTGYFDLTRMLLSIPLALIATSFSNVLLQSISERFLKKQSILNDLKKVFYIVSGIIVAEIMVISLFGTELFVFIFGSDWEVSGNISKILVWSFAFNFLVSSFSCIYISMRKIKIYSMWQFLYFIIIISLIFFRYLEFTDFLKVYMILEVLAYMLISANMIYIIYRYEKSTQNPVE